MRITEVVGARTVSPGVLGRRKLPPVLLLLGAPMDIQLTPPSKYTG